LLSAEKLISDDALASPTAFHIHQSVEKSFKALLELYDYRVPKTHNLLSLLALLQEKGIGPESDIDTLAKIDQIYVDSRYPGDIGLVQTEHLLRKHYTTSLTEKSLKMQINKGHLKSVWLKTACAGNRKRRYNYPPGDFGVRILH
jgi:HEPN domain-containing protein